MASSYLSICSLFSGVIQCARISWPSVSFSAQSTFLYSCRIWSHIVLIKSPFLLEYVIWVISPAYTAISDCLRPQFTACSGGARPSTQAGNCQVTMTATQVSLVSGHSVYKMNDYSRFSMLANITLQMSNLKLVYKLVGLLLAICRPSGCTVASGVVGVVVGICNRSQMRTSKCTCLIFGVSMSWPWLETHKRNFW